MEFTHIKLCDISPFSFAQGGGIRRGDYLHPSCHEPASGHRLQCSSAMLSHLLVEPCTPYTLLKPLCLTQHTVITPSASLQSG